MVRSRNTQEFLSITQSILYFRRITCSLSPFLWFLVCLSSEIYVAPSWLIRNNGLLSYSIYVINDMNCFFFAIEIDRRWLLGMFNQGFIKQIWMYFYTALSNDAVGFDLMHPADHVNVHYTHQWINECLRYVISLPRPHLTHRQKYALLWSQMVLTWGTFKLAQFLLCKNLFYWYFSVIRTPVKSY